MQGLPKGQIEFELLGIGTVLKRYRLVVPLNQREYSWEERHVQELFQDLADAISSGKQAYFLGALVLTIGDEGTLEIADGQQRLATTTILIAAIRDHFYHRKDHEMVKDLDGFLQSFVRETREHNPRLRLNVTDNDFFTRRVLKVPGDDARENVSSTQPSHKLLARAAEIAEQHVGNILSPLSESAKDEHLNRWLGFIEDSAQVITLSVPDDMDAYLMFETLNDRGLRVSQLDLVKNYLFSEADNRISEAQDRWSSMNGALEALEDDDAISNFLRHLLISIYGPVRQREVLEKVRANIRGRTSSMEFLDTLSSAAADYVVLQTPTSMKWSGKKIKMRKFISDLLLLRVSPLRPLMLAIFRKFSADETEVAFRRFISWSVRWLIAGGARSGGVETAIGIAAKKVTSGEIQTADGLKKALEPALPNDAGFKVAFRSATVTNHRIARYYLRTLEVACRDEPEPEWVPNEDTVITLEHVLPQHPGVNWPSIESAIHSTYYKRLGNMALLAGTLNTDIGNHSFNEKRKTFKTSDYRLTKEIALKQMWGPPQIEKRQDRLSELSVKAWPLL